VEWVYWIEKVGGGCGRWWTGVGGVAAEGWPGGRMVLAGAGG